METSPDPIRIFVVKYHDKDEYYITESPPDRITYFFTEEQANECILYYCGTNLFQICGFDKRMQSVHLDHGDDISIYHPFHEECLKIIQAK